MKTVIADASIWIGALVKKDKWHENGKKFLKWVDNEANIRVIIPIGIIYEVIAGILNKSYGGFEKANKVLKLFMNHKKFEVYYNTENSFQEVIDIFRQYKIFSLVDATIVIFYENKKFDLLFTTDKDFDSCSFINKLEYPV
ncbi:MAG: PIN domain-containing protein [Candidatus Lokiarchaeota archaeon]|nr:PIN domain-containing protein [Candidatus Lokiarchaeota archaeon]MBD3201207.1 PIN domain-containing protein [Candidatus Lokiarchaeota archaeon]